MSQLEGVLGTPLAVLLGGVSPKVFSKPPREVSSRELARSMSETLGQLREGEEYAVLTNRGVPTFLILPIDPGSWMKLLLASSPGLDSSQSESTLHSVDEV